jgi:gliding motility-associated-like protein
MVKVFAIQSIKRLFAVNLLLIAFLSFQINDVFAQLTVTTGQTAQQLVQNVLVGSGVTVSNVTYSGAAGTIGHFTTGGTATNLGMSSRIVMASGLVDGSNGQYAVGSGATNFNSWTTGTTSDPDLANLVPGYTINDAAALAFDFTPLSDTIKFRYVFGSEEYPEWVGSSFNDVFGFFISGPNPAGGNYSSLNIAKIPGTSTAVSINNVNSGSYSQYYVDNQYGVSIVYDGFTTVLTAWCKVIPCLTYHIKLAIGDAGDSAYDSAVFLEENSFSSNAINVATTYTTSLDTMAIEGCSDAIVSFTLQNPATSPYTIYYTIGGNATNGTDYTTLPASITIPTGQDSVSIIIDPLYDGVSEGNEFVTLTVQTSVCGNTQVYSVWIKDNTQLTAFADGDTTICGGSATLISIGLGGILPYSYLWSNGAGTTSTVTVTPASTTNYIVTVTDGCSAIATESVLVTVGGGYANAGNDTSICFGGLASLLASGGTGYHWSNGINTASNPVSPVQTTTYYLTVSGSCDGFDTVTVFVNPLPTIVMSATPDSICSGESSTLNATGGTSFFWTSTPTDPSLSGHETVANPTVSPSQTTVYTVRITDNNTCSNTASITVYIKPNPTSTFTINPAVICIGQNATVLYTGTAASGATYAWDFDAGIATGSGPGPYQVNWSTDGNKNIILTVTDNGCQSGITSNSVTVNPVPTAGFTATNITGCAPLTVFFHDSSQYVNATTVYDWDFGDGGSSTSQSPAHTYIQPGTYDITLTVINGNTCSDGYTLNNLVNAYPAPNAYFTTVPHYVSIFDPVVYFYDETTGSPSPVSWHWTLGNGDEMDVQNFVYTYADTGTYLITLSVSNQYGCVDSAFNYLVVNPDYTIYVPNAFTPNNDALNDYFQPYGLNILAYDMKIFDRWGKMIFESKDLNFGWDGKVDGNKAQQGVYAYTIYYKDALKKEHTVYGQVTLIR